MAGGNQPEDGAQRKAWREREVGLQHESQNTVQYIRGKHREQFCFFSRFRDIIEGLHGTGVFLDALASLGSMLESQSVSG